MVVETSLKMNLYIDTYHSQNEDRSLNHRFKAAECTVGFAQNKISDFIPHFLHSNHSKGTLQGISKGFLYSQYSFKKATP